MNDDEEKFSLRDKLAMEILNGVLSGQTDATSALLSDNPAWRRGAEEKAERITRSCYKLADLMRKARLTTFE